MDKHLEFLALEGGPYVEIEKLKTERLKKEAEPEQEFDKMNLFVEFFESETKILEGEYRQVINNIVSVADRNVGPSYSPEGLIEEAKVLYRKEAAKLALPFLMLKCLPQLRDGLEKDVQTRLRGEWAGRCNGIDEMLRLWEAKIPKPFDPAMVNIETMGKFIPAGPDHTSLRFPVDRVGMADNRYYDKWLTEILKSKPIFFDSPQYTDRLMEAHALYLKTAADEQKAAQASVTATTPPPQEQPQQPDGYVVPTGELQAMAEHREESEDYGMRELRRRGRV